jgi:sigma-B regulation protein RsbU (phosphoserine phosphatase)
METARLAIHARGESWEVDLNPLGSVIGRAKPADIVLDSRMISRRHVRIFQDPFGRWLFEDLGSSNGTFVHGRRIDVCPVLPGEPVHVGPFALKIVQSPQWLTAKGSLPAYDVNLVLADFETEFFHEDKQAAQPPSAGRASPTHAGALPCPERWAELTQSLSELTNLAALYPEVCRHLGKTRNTVTLVLRAPVNGPLPQKPEVCAVYLGDNLYDTTVGDASGFYPSLPVAFQERAYRLSRHVIERARSTHAPAMAKTIFSSDTEVTVTLIDEFSPRAIICAPLSAAAETLDLLYLDFPFEESFGVSPEEMFAFTRLVAEEVAKVRKSLLLMELRAERSILDSQLLMAREMQSKLAPVVSAEVAPALDLAVYHKPVAWVGGDYCDVWRIGEQHAAFAVGHVDAVGLPAALFLQNLRLILRPAVSPEGSLSDVLTAVNGQLVAHPLNAASATIFLAVADLRKDLIRYVNAAHPQPLALLSSGWAAVGQPGTAKLGTKDAVFHEHSLKLKEIKGLVLFTPGLLQTRSPRGEELGILGLTKTLKSAPHNSAQDLVNAVAGAVETFRQSLAQMADVTVLALTAK